MEIKNISTVLVSKDWYYIWKNWELPKRYKWDKQFITNLVKNRTVLMSEATLKDLPLSILKECGNVVLDPKHDHDVNFWIWTFKHNSDMFIIIRSEDNLNWWKEFYWNNIEKDYDLIMDINNIMIYLKKS